MVSMNPFRLVRRVMAPVTEPSAEVTERVQLFEARDDGATGPSEVDPTSG